MNFVLKLLAIGIAAYCLISCTVTSTIAKDGRRSSVDSTYAHVRIDNATMAVLPTKSMEVTTDISDFPATEYRSQIQQRLAAELVDHTTCSDAQFRVPSNTVELKQQPLTIDIHTYYVDLPDPGERFTFSGMTPRFVLILDRSKVIPFNTDRYATGLTKEDYERIFSERQTPVALRALEPQMWVGANSLFSKDITVHQVFYCIWDNEQGRAMNYGVTGVISGVTDDSSVPEAWNHLAEKLAEQFVEGTPLELVSTDE